MFVSRRGAGLMLALTAGCHTDGCDTSGFRELAVKDPRGIDFPGQKIGDVGSFVPERALGKNGELVAIAGHDDAGQVVVVSAHTGRSCFLETSSEGENSSQVIAGALEDMLVTLESEDDAGLGRLRLYDSDCGQIGEPFEAARPVSKTERLMPIRLLLIANEDELVAVNPETRAATVVDDDVVWVSLTDERALVHAGGQLVVRNMALGEMRRLGEQVSEVVVDAKRGAVAYVDGGRLVFMADPDASPSDLDESACEVSFADQAFRPGDTAARFVSYRPSCDSPDLVAYDVKERRRYELGPARSSRAEVRALSSESIAVFFEAASDAQDEPLLVVSREGTDNLNLGSSTLAQVGRSLDGTVNVWVDAETDQSRVVNYSGSEDLETVLTKVTGFEVASFPERALVEQPDSTRSLIALEGNEEPTVVAEGALDVGVGDPGASLFGENVNDGVGDLRMSLADDGRPTTIGEAVHLSTAEFAYTTQSVFFIQEYDAQAGVGELCMRVVRNGDTFCEPGVVSYTVLIRPGRAVAYVKQSAGGMRLFLARVE